MSSLTVVLLHCMRIAGFIYGNRVTTPCNMHASSSSAQQQHQVRDWSPWSILLEKKRTLCRSSWQRSPWTVCFNWELNESMQVMMRKGSLSATWSCFLQQCVLRQSVRKLGTGEGGERGHMDGCKGRRYGESWEILQEWDASLQVSLSPTKTASASSILFMFHIFGTLWVHRLLVVGTHLQIDCKHVSELPWLVQLDHFCCGEWFEGNGIISEPRMVVWNGAVFATVPTITAPSTWAYSDLPLLSGSDFTAKTRGVSGSNMWVSLLVLLS